MTEILTESFCERCGTRYTFESARPRARLKGVRVLSRGLKNFVMSDDNSMDEAMAAARSDTDRELTADQLDAFHKTFNFCMSCRQYTCPNCWNEAEARCLTCAPHLGQEIMPAPFPDLVTSSYLVADPVDTVATNGSNGSNGFGYGAIVEPDQATVDTSDVASRLQAMIAPPELEEPAATVPEVEPVAADVVPPAHADHPIHHLRIAKREGHRVVRAEARPGRDHEWVRVHLRGEREQLVAQVGVVPQVTPRPLVHRDALVVPALVVVLVEREERQPAALDLLAQHVGHVAVGPLIVVAHGRREGEQARPTVSEPAHVHATPGRRGVPAVMMALHPCAHGACSMRNGRARLRRRPQADS